MKENTETCILETAEKLFIVCGVWVTLFQTQKKTARLATYVWSNLQVEANNL